MHGENVNGFSGIAYAKVANPCRTPAFCYKKQSKLHI